MTSLIQKLLGREKDEAPPPPITPAPPPIDPPEPVEVKATKNEPEHYPEVVAPEMLQADWHTYRPAVTVRAKIIEQPFSVKEPDGKYRKGEAGDYIVVAEGHAYVCPATAFNAAWLPV